MTSLSEQLRRLALPGAVGRVEEVKRASLLFDPRKAATLDRDTYFALGVNGLEELSSIDPTLHTEFHEPLFSESAKNTERTMLTQEENKKLNLHIQNFLFRVSPYFLLRPTQKCLEWMIYRFRIHAFNVDEILCSILPYHETNLFVKLVQLLDISHPTNKWCWIAPIQGPGVTLAKGTICTHCSKDMGFFYFVCTMVTKAIKSHSHLTDSSAPLRSIINFYTTVVLGAINALDKISDQFLAQLVPFFVKGLKSKVLDFKAGTYMIICQVATKTNLTEKVTASLLKTISKHRTVKLHKELLTTVILICQCQETVKFLPKIAFEELTRMPGLMDLLEEIHKTNNIERFLKIFLERLIPATFTINKANSDCIVSDGSDMEDTSVNLNQMLQDIVEKFQFSPNLQRLIVRSLVEGFIDQELELPSRSSSIIQRVQKKFPEAFDDVVADLLKHKYSSKTNSAAANRLNKFITLSMESARHQVVSDGDASLLLSLCHPEPAVRISAIQHFDSMFPIHPNLTGSDFVRESIQHRLSIDDSASVVLTVLKLVNSYPDILFHDLDFACNLLIKLIYKNRNDPDWNDVSLAALTLLSSEAFSSASDNIKNKISVVIYDVMLQEICLDCESSSYNIAVRSSYMEKKTDVLFTLTPGQDVESLSSSIVKKLKKKEDPSESVSSLYRASKEISDLLNTGENLTWKKYLPSHFIVLNSTFPLLKSETATSEFLKIVSPILSDILADANGIVDLDWPEEEAEKDENGKSSEQLGGISTFKCALHKAVKIYQDNGADSLMAATSLNVLLAILQKFLQLFNDILRRSESSKDIEYWDSPIKSADEEEPEEKLKMLRHNIYNALMDFQATAGNTKSEVGGAVRQMLQLFLTDLFPSPQDVLLFLAPYWTSCCLGCDMPPVSPTLLVQSLYLGNSMIQALQKDDAESVTSPTSPVVISLITALTSELQAVRKASLICLSSRAKSSLKISYKELIDHLVNHREEIEADSNSLNDIVGVFFSLESIKKRKSSRKIDQTLDLLLKHHICYEDAPMWIRATLLKEVLKKVNSKSVLLQLMPIFEKLLNRCSETKISAKEDDSNSEATSLSLSEASFLVEGLTKINPQHMMNDEIKSVFMKALSCDLELSIESQQTTSPQKTILGMINKTFFAKLPSSEIQQQVICKMLDVGTASQASSTITAISKAFKFISLSSQHVVVELKKIMNLREPSVSTTSVLGAKRAKIRKEKLKKSSSSSGKVDGEDENIPTSIKWKRITLLLELLQHKKKISNIQDLFLPLFEVLEFVLENTTESSEETEESAIDGWEYVKQLILTTLLNFLQRLKSDVNEKQLLSEHCKVELLVHCVRSSDNAQTQQHALLLLSEVATIFPDRVLHSVMAIFTFMGLHLLRQDDSYSFQVISTTIRTIIPALMKSKITEENNNLTNSKEKTVLMIIRVFVDSLPHIPAHRRITVFEELLNTLGAREHLWMTLILLVDQYACKPQLGREQNAEDMETDSSLVRESEANSTDPFMSSAEIWGSISDLFAPFVQMQSLIHFVEYIHSLPEDVSKYRPAARSKTYSKKEPVPMDVIGVTLHTNNQLRRFKLASLTFFSYLLEQRRTKFTIKLDKEEEDEDTMKVDDNVAEEAAKMTVLFQKFFEKLLDLIHKAVESSKTVEQRTEKYYKVFIHKSYEVMHKLNFLLPMNSFLLIINGLLKHPLVSTKRKAVELFAERINFVSGNFQQEEVSLVLDLAKELMQFAVISTDQRSPEKHEEDLLRYSSLITLKLIVRSCGKQNPTTFIDMLQMIGNSISSGKDENIQILSASILCLAELCTSLKAYCIAHLNCFVPSLLQITCTSRSLQNETLLFSCLTAMHRVLENLPNFLSPYLDVILSKITALSLLPKYTIEDIHETESNQSLAVKIGLRLKAITTILATKIPSRTLVPALQKCREKTEKKRPKAIRCLSAIVHRHVTSLDKDVIGQNGMALVSLFMELFDFRTKMDAELTMEDIDEVEDQIVKTLITMMLKLPENSFRPLYFKLFDWACSPENPPDRLISFYILMHLMAEQMKGLFALFAGHLLNNIADILKENLKSEAQTETSPLEPQNHLLKRHILLSSICDTLRTTMLYDTSGFLTRDRFELLMLPLVNQLDNIDNVKKNENELDAIYVNDHVIPCLGQLAASVTDDVCWKPFNYQILLKSRHDSPQVRYASLDAIHAVAEKLGEDYTILLPESVPFLAELMEDDDETVEKKCHEVLRRLEKILGEPLQKYF